MHSKTVLSGALCVVWMAAAVTGHCENSSYSGSGGSFTDSTTVGQSIVVQSTPLSGTNASISLNCPITFFGAGTYQWNWTCAGGTLTVTSTDGSLAVNAAFASATMTFSGSGGGRGGHTSYSYVFKGTVNGQATVNGASQAILGSVAFNVNTTSNTGSGAVSSLSFGWNSAYSPVVVAMANGGQLLGADNLTGVNLTSYGSWGSGPGAFGTVAGLAHDASGRIYISDATNSVIDRIDDLTGANWTSYGSAGNGNGNFQNPAGVAIDAQGEIWVADAGNNRIVRMNDMNGTNWTAFGTAGSGANQFSDPTALAFDASGRIYVADTGNARLVRMDDLNGTNWTTLSSIAQSVYLYNLTGVNGVVILPSGQIVVSTAGGYLFGMADMTGANAVIGGWTSLSGLSADGAGAMFVSGGFTPGLAQTLSATGAGEYTGSMGQGSIQASAVLAMAGSGAPPAAAQLSTTALAYGSQNVGEPGATQTVTLTNYGGTPMTIISIGATADFPVQSNCGASLAGGSTCTVSITFEPTTTGAIAANLTVSTSGAHPVLQVALTGTGTAPAAVLRPGSLTFAAQTINTTSAAQSVTLSNPGTGPLTIASIVTAGDFATTSTCPAVLAAGGSCTLKVTFTPTATGARIGSITITDDATPGGATQVVALSGTGSATAPAVTWTPQSLIFPNEAVNTTSAAQTVTITNASKAALAVSAASFPTAFPGTTTCSKSLAAGKTCTLSVTFKPTQAVAYSGTVTITIGTSVVSVGVSGTGVQGAGPQLSITPNPLAFNGYVVGDNPTKSITVLNPTGGPVGITSVALSGSSTFKASNGCSTLLAAGASCTVKITFTPKAETTYTATLTVKEASGASTAVAITGTATTGN